MMTKTSTNPHGHKFIKRDGDIDLSKVPKNRIIGGNYHSTATIIDTSKEKGIHVLMDILRVKDEIDLQREK